MLFSKDDINDELLKGNFLKLAKTISSIEDRDAASKSYLEALSPRNTPIIGITGPPGAGKSTLISAMIEIWISEGKRIAVLSVDPSSPFHHGAILGDRIRMKDWYLHPNVFIRSLASRGHLGGLTSSMIELTTLLQSLSFDIIILETVGVGQSEVEIASLADTTIVVLVPEAGDDVQMMKSGLMEVADLFVVNKSDRPDAQIFSNHLQQMIMTNSNSSKTPKVIATIAAQKIGVLELVHAIDEQQLLEKSDQKLRGMMAKVIQIITAHQLNKLDYQFIENSVKNEIANGNTNLFHIAKQFFI
ncbi:MAG: methylmalonyl Co-A mutase-associated GTPase MeaB [Bacteroidetes bacterium]|jgi:LAO/AO transport system kinase|nr:methylmalonyl Co-A mutase-associated GTPase MeaB [Bacteroidota bacterium]